MKINEAIKELKRQARAHAAEFFNEFGETINSATTDWDVEAFNAAYSGLSFDSKEALETCSDFRPFIPVAEAIDRNAFSDRGWEVYQRELVEETQRLAATA